MSGPVRNTMKLALRKHMKTDVLATMSPKARAQQSKEITEKVLLTEAFRNAQRVSMYLSTPTEVNTYDLMCEMFRLGKQVYMPFYTKGGHMEMVRLRDLADYESLPLTSWNIKQPEDAEGRENALTNGHGIDLFLIPGVAFSLNGGRLGQGGGYYDRYLNRHMAAYPQKKITLMALAFCEQIVKDEELPLDEHDVRLHYIITP